ncbi:MAG TPA: hypothetical protein PLZ68_12215 [Ferruginibacter sp.]|nr:hypothetical protein [Ferruginibacter sp.]
MEIKSYYPATGVCSAKKVNWFFKTGVYSILLLWMILQPFYSIGQSRTFTSSGTFLVPAGVTSVNVQCWGAGGGGSTTSIVGGGGGGGAYASGSVAVIPGSTYNIVIGSRGASGTNGGNTSFNNTSIVAAGGTSAGNNAAAAGVGGSVAASVGTVRYAGGNGAAGSGSVAGGGGGGAGSTGTGNNANTYIRGAAKTLNGGAGGNGRRQTRGNGSNGANYGGGGGGAYGNGTSANGGLGGRGLAIISWTCPVYSLTSVSAPLTVCRGSAARITLNASAANLPVGTYTVTYNLSAPNAANNRTVTMTVSTPGSGSFNTNNLNTAGATTITITKLTSGVTGRNCSSVISSNNTAVISMNNALAVITTQPASQSVCVGSAVTLSVTATDAIRYQWRKNGISISGATASTYNIPSYCSCDAGTYSVVVANSCGNRASANAYISTKASLPAVTASASAMEICAGTPINLNATTPSNAVTLLYENFNGPVNNFTTTNTSTGGTPANAAWTLRPDGYSYNAVTFNSNDNTQFYISNSNAQGTGGAAATILQTAPFSTIGLNAASLNFYQYYRVSNTTERARVEISVNGTSWTALATYSSTQGAPDNFALVTFNLSAYLNRPLVMIRFRYTATTAWYWAIDNVNVSGTLAAPATFRWTSAPAGYNSFLQNPTGILPLSTTDYTVTATNAAGCTNSSNVAITVNTPPFITAQPVASAPVCAGNGIQTITVGATGTGLSYNWRKAGAAVVNGGTVSGQGTATLVLTNPTAADEGSYDVLISGTCAPAVTSGSAVVSLNSNTMITTPVSPTSQTVLINNTAANLTFAAEGTSLGYQWYSNNLNSNYGGTNVGTANGGQTNTYMPPANAEGTLYYYCVVTGGCGTLSTDPVAVTVTNINTWAGGGSSNWNSSVNWTMGMVPIGTNDAIIPAGNVPYPVLTSATTVRNLQIDAGAALTIGTNQLTINGSVSGTGTITGSETSDLLIAGNAGTLWFTPGGKNNYLKNFTIGNGASATLGSELNITGGSVPDNEGTLTVTGTGVLNSMGFLHIKSNEFGTARIAQGNSNGGYITGDVTVERYIPKNASKGWRLLASNTSGQTINAAWQEGVSGSLLNPNPGFGFNITSSGANLAAVQAQGFDTLSLGKSIFKYIQSVDMLDYVPNTNSTQLSSEHGYFVFIRGDRSAGQFGAGAPSTSTIIRSKGTLFQGDQAAVNLAAGQYALVRNPFASRIDVRNIVRTGGVVAAFQVWDPKLTGAFGGGAFQTFTRNNTTGNYEISPGGGSYGINGSVQNYIESGAAFYVQANGSAGTVHVTEACKTAGSLVSSFRPVSPLTAPARILFNVYANNPSSTDMVDGGFIDFDEAYSNEVDVFDVRKNQNFNENIALERNNTELVVERRQPVTNADTILFKMYNLRRINYTIQIDATGFDTLLNTAVLKDSYTGAETELSLSSVSTYTFTVNTDAASASTSRFKILMRRAGVVPVTFITAKATATIRKTTVQWKVAAEINIARYIIEVSADGIRFNPAAEIAATGAGIYNWVDETPLNGNHFYRIKAAGTNGHVVYSNILKVAEPDRLPALTVSPNPVLNNEMNISFLHQPKGTYNVTLINAYGQAVFTTVIRHLGGKSNYKVTLPPLVKAGRFELLVNNRDGHSQTISIINIAAQ